jgi:hypothetical protein
MTDDECREFVLAYVRRFWWSKVNPQLWITGLLKILEKNGDLSKAGNYRGIVMLEVPYHWYKVASNVLKVRLTTIFEALGDHVEAQNGFRPWRGSRLHLEPQDNHAQAQGERARVPLDLVKVFDRCDRALLWAAMEKLGVPPTVLSVLKALHAKVDVKFDVDGVEKNLSILPTSQNHFGASSPRCRAYPAPPPGNASGALEPGRGAKHVREEKNVQELL